PKRRILYFTEADQKINLRQVLPYNTSKRVILISGFWIRVLPDGKKQDLIFYNYRSGHGRLFLP
ncbi:MAG: hypothetical protein KAJ25_02725, partial [Desulfobacula sp.]|nr:hypothetical protein [Desulfobacula sp.]